VVNATPWPLYPPPENNPGIHYIHAVWARGPVWAGAKNVAPTGIRSPDRPASSESLYVILREGCGLHIPFTAAVNLWYRAVALKNDHEIVYLHRASETLWYEYIATGLTEHTRSLDFIHLSYCSNWSRALKHSALQNEEEGFDLHRISAIYSCWPFKIYTKAEVILVHPYHSNT
jgi:hypothetical protein